MLHITEPGAIAKGKLKYVVMFKIFFFFFDTAVILNEVVVALSKCNERHYFFLQLLLE